MWLSSYFGSKVCADPQKGSHRKVNSANQPRLDQISRALKYAARVNIVFAFLRSKIKRHSLYNWKCS